jgi:hypothetical protein
MMLVGRGGVWRRAEARRAGWWTNGQVSAIIAA